MENFFEDKFCAIVFKEMLHCINPTWQDGMANPKMVCGIVAV
jgi:hypothetical protein